MLYVPTGIGGVLQHHIRNRQRLDWGRLSGLYLLALAGGAMITAGVVYLTETVSVLFGEDYSRMRENADGGLPEYDLFGAQWDPTHALTWLLPAVLLMGGIALLVRTRRQIGALWDNRDRSIETTTGAVPAGGVR